MTGNVKRLHSIISIITAFMLIAASFIMPVSSAVKAEGEETVVSINKFSLELISGAEETAEGFVWTPEDSSAGHRFLFRVVYSFSGTGYIKEGGVKVVLPRWILHDRDGGRANDLELSIPHISSGAGMNEFAYDFDDDDNIVVTNTKRLSAAENGYFELAYVTNKTTFEYRDMEWSDPCSASISIKTSSGYVYADSDPIRVAVNTYAFVTECRTIAPEVFCQKWESRWGDKPADADDYYYLEWTVTSYISATQEYDFSLSDVVSDNDFRPSDLVPTDPNVSVAGYMLQGQEEYSSVKNAQGLTSTGYRTDKVLTRHKKVKYEPLEQYTLKHKASAYAVPGDTPQEISTRSGSALYIYDTPVFVYPYGNWNSWEYGTVSWQEYFHYEWNVADYRLQEFKDGEYDHLDGDIKFCVYTIGMPYPRTLEQNADMDDWRNYGKKSLNYLITSDKFYFCDDITTKEEVITRPDDIRVLTADDYEIEYIRFTERLNDATFDEESLRFRFAAGTFNENDVIYFDAKFNGSDEWVENVASWNMGNNSGTYNEEYVKNIVSGKVDFLENCTGYRVRASNPHYRTQFLIFPYCKLKRSPYILEQCADRNKVWLTNESSYLVTDAWGDVCFSKEMVSRDYIVGFEKKAKIEKTVASVTNDTLNSCAKVKWIVNVGEQFVTSQGIDYVLQDTGVFYDLLPLGCEFYPESLELRDGERTLDASEYDYRTVSNYNNTGRTLLVVNIKERFYTAQMFYTTAYSWDNIIDYGRSLLNTVAYETGNDFLADGFPDDGGTVIESELIDNLDLFSDDNRFGYTEHRTVVDVVRSASLGLTKKVKSSGDAYYTPSATVSQNGVYTYRLRYAAPLDSKAKNIILYDSLENYNGGGLSSSFHGTLESVDVQQIARLGAAPVVYYSSQPVELGTQPDLDELRNGVRVWKTASEFGDISAAKAVAIDVRKAASGDDFVLGPTKSVVAVLYMKAPAQDNSQNEVPCAYNEVYLSNTIIEEEDIEDYYISHNYTKVDYRVKADVGLLKADSTDPETVVQGVEFTLEGTSDYGTIVKQPLKTDRYGKVLFKGVEKGRYTLTETMGTDDYQTTAEIFNVLIDGSGRVYINDEPMNEGAYYLITDVPRAHADVYFFKRDFAGKGRLINDAVFELSGRSGYGNDIAVIERSSGGKVVFRNIELGTYKLVELEPAPGYLRNGTVYKVQVDEAGVFTITVDMKQGAKKTDTLTQTASGKYTIFNESLHSFTVYKIGYTYKRPVAGACFELNGVSDYGTAVGLTGETAESGLLTFDSLEPGIYTLTETSVPEGYQLDDSPRTVEIDKYGNVSVSGTEQDENGYFVITNKENGTITVVKKWLDNDSSGRYEHSGSDTPATGGSAAPGRDQRSDRGDSPNRAGDGSNDDGRTEKLPTIVVSSEIPYPHAMIKGLGGRSVLTEVTAVSNIRSFSHFTGSDSEAHDIIDGGNAVRIDDSSTEYSIYAWYDSGTGAVSWWSNAAKVFLTDSSRTIWSELSNCRTIDTGGIDTSLVTDMSRMFINDSALTSLDFSEANTSNVTSMRSMFEGCKALRIFDIGTMDTGKVTDMGSMFKNCIALAEIDLSRTDTSRVRDTSSMFEGCTALTEMDLSTLDLSSDTSLNSTFSGCTALQNVYFPAEGLSCIETTEAMFKDCSSLLAVDLSNRSMDSLKYMRETFYGCSKLKTIDLTNFLTPSLVDMHTLFRGCGSLQSLDLSSLDTSGVTSMRNMLRDCSSLSELNLSDLDTSSVTDMQAMFYGCKAMTYINVTNFNTSNCINFTGMFYDCTNLERVDVSSFDTSNANDIRSMFEGCYKLAELDLTSFNTSKVTNVSFIFNHCQRIKNLDLSSFDTSNVTNFKCMFQDCVSLESIDVSHFNTSSATDLSYMFYGCSTLKEIDLSSFDTSNVTTLKCLADNNANLERLDLSSFYTPKLKNAREMVGWSPKIMELDLSGFIMDNVTDAQGMLRRNGALKTIYVSDLWDCSNLTSTSSLYMFQNDFSLEGQAGTKYNGSYQNYTYAHIDSTSDPGYLTRKEWTKVYEPQMTNKAYFGTGEDNTSVLGRVCELSEIKSFSHFEGDAAAAEEIINSGRAVRIDDGTELNPPIYAWLNDDGSLQWWSSAAKVYLNDANHTLWRGLSSCESIATDEIDTTGLVDASYLFEGCSSLKAFSFSSFYNNNITDATGMFSGCSSLEELDLSSFVPAALQKMSYMFKNCSSLSSIAGNFSTVSVTDIKGLFSGCTSLESVTNKKFSTETATDLSEMFMNCKSMRSIDLSGFRTSNVTDMSRMFSGCEQLVSVNTGLLDTSSVKDLSAMFKDCKKIKSIDLHGFELSDAEDLSEMFSGCSSLAELDIGSFEPTKAENMTRMFADCPALETIYATERWNIAALQFSDDMFAGDTALSGGNGTEYDADIVDAARAYIDTAEREGYLTLQGTIKEKVTFTTDSDNCEVEIQDDDTWVFVFTGLDPNMPYYIWEEDYDGYESTNPKDNYAVVIPSKGDEDPLTESENSVITVTNRSTDDPPPEPSYGSLKIYKLLRGEGLTDEDTSRSFLFTVTLTDENDESLSGTSVYGNTAFRDGTAAVRLTGGSDITITGIPAGWHYSVSETPVDGFTSETASSSGVIAADEISEVLYTNTKSYTEEDNNSFRIKKLVKGNYELEDHEFELIISLIGLRVGQTYSLSDGTEFTADNYGRAIVRITLGNNDEVTVKDIPIGAEYRITEPAGSYISSYIIENSADEGEIFQSSGNNTTAERALSTLTETVDKGEDILVTFTNTLDIRQPLTLKKVVLNSSSSSQDRFEFTVEITGLAQLEQISTDTMGSFRADTGGRLTAQLYLGNDETVTFRGLPVKAKYRITEKESFSLASYEITDSNNTGAIEKASDSSDDISSPLSTEWETVNEGENVSVIFTNTKTDREISVTKLVDMTYGLKKPSEYYSEEFSFTAELEGLAPGREYTVQYTARNTTGVLSEETFTAPESGSAVFSFGLSHGQTASFRGLPLNASYRITEQAVPFYVPSYKITGNEGAVIAAASGSADSVGTALSTQTEAVDTDDHDVNIEFTNTYSKPNYVLPDAGTNDIRYFLLFSGIGVLVFASAFAYVSREKRSF